MAHRGRGPGLIGGIQFDLVAKQRVECGAIDVPKPKSAGGRAKKAGKALECESSESDDEEEDDESSEHEDGSKEDEIE